MSPASQGVWREANARGVLQALAEAGALVAHSTCGPCFGGRLGVLGYGDVCMSSSNRNYRGRMGSAEASVYLGNAATVAATAVAGRIIDPRSVIQEGWSVAPSIRGRVWTFGDNISTDLMLPGRITYPVMAGQVSPEEAATHCMSADRPGWCNLVRSGHIIVGGANFGAGSGRPAHLPLQAPGIQVVLAESVARLFYRNCINGAFLVIACPGIGALVEEGDTVDVRRRDGMMSHPGSERELTFPALPPESAPMEILRAGGLIPSMKARLGLNAGSG